MHILITGGATQEAIDGVRYITNMSTGRTGTILADYFTLKGNDVYYLSGKHSIKPRQVKNIFCFESFFDLNKLLEQKINEQQFDVIIHLAAVSDYSIKEIIVDDKIFSPSQVCKLDSTSDVAIKLKPNFKIVTRIKEYAHDYNPFLIAFKLTNTGSEDDRLEAALKLSMKNYVDLLVHNDLNEMDDRNQHIFSIYNKNKVLRKCNSAVELAEALDGILKIKMMGV
ncbi:MAG: phosphopantothenoylcysteine decarboxylase [Pseudomonadota bacterium]